ncbi:hypothetical protein [Oceaniglobus roseus]|uniref:hypothetical protein n=1 Tax=Oceaniglobus roseus TaxID=1737570 RepID=UPI000C7E89FA|nr:hypothetical protein [Kandeliimicrobium roseum]
MALNITDVPDRATFAADPEADFQPWTGIASDGNTLRFTRMRSAQRRSWCAIDDARQMRRLTQGLSFNGHFPTPGEVLITTNQIPSQSFALSFDLPVRGVGLDVEPAPAAVVPGQGFKVSLVLADTTTMESVEVEKMGAIGGCVFIGASCDSDRIDRMIVRVALVDGGGQEDPVEFAVNRMELLAPVGNIV